MRREALIFNLQAIHPVWRVLLGILAVGLLGFFLFFGIVMVAVFALIALVSGAVLAVRSWWLGFRGRGTPPAGDALEGEFIVVERRRITRPPE